MSLSTQISKLLDATRFVYISLVLVEGPTPTISASLTNSHWFSSQVFTRSIPILAHNSYLCSHAHSFSRSYNNSAYGSKSSRLSSALLSSPFRVLSSICNYHLLLCGHTLLWLVSYRIASVRFLRCHRHGIPLCPSLPALSYCTYCKYG